MSDTSSSVPNDNAFPAQGGSSNDRNPAVVNTPQTSAPARQVPSQSATSPSLFVSSTSASSTDATGSVISTAASRASSSTPLLNRSSNLSVGATIGVGVGSFAVGLALAAMVVFGLWMFRNRRRHSGQTKMADFEMKNPASSDDSDSTFKPVLFSSVAAVPRGSVISLVGSAMGIPAGDNVVTQAYASLRTQINNHVLTYYRLSPSLDQVPLEVLSEALSAPAGALHDMQELLSDYRTRTAALRFVLAWIALARCRRQGPLDSTFIPKEALACLQSLTLAGTDPAILQKWRAFTASIIGDRMTASQPNGAEHPERLSTIDEEHSRRNSSAAATLVAEDGSAGSNTAAIRAAAAVADAVLRPYAKAEVGAGERRRNLEEVMRRASRLALALFAQPGECRFDWAARRGELTVFPGLVMVEEHGAIDEAGSRSSMMERTVVAKERVAVEELGT